MYNEAPQSKRMCGRSERKPSCEQRSKSAKLDRGSHEYLNNSAKNMFSSAIFEHSKHIYLESVKHKLNVLAG